MRTSHNLDILVFLSFFLPLPFLLTPVTHLTGRLSLNTNLPVGHSVTRSMTASPYLSSDVIIALSSDGEGIFPSAFFICFRLIFSIVSTAEAFIRRSRYSFTSPFDKSGKKSELLKYLKGFILSIKPVFIIHTYCLLQNRINNLYCQ